MAGPAVYESRLELARLLLADMDPAARAIYAQRCHLTARVGGRVRRHVPDFLLVMKDKLRDQLSRDQDSLPS